LPPVMTKSQINTEPGAFNLFSMQQRRPVINDRDSDRNDAWPTFDELRSSGRI
jgi:hypothetical protein